MRGQAPPPLPDAGDQIAVEPLVIFGEYERLETSTAVQITRENMLDIAEHFGWNVEFEGEGQRQGSPRTPVLKKSHSTFRIGDWITETGHRRETFGRPWRPKGTYRMEAPE